ncbi:hypothetical protein [Halorussus amylolyticus]|uniref:hypothetical protein n=1 Tax=Halorussus amylolyticus TaxID=1126242 RepID=UPI00192F2BB2|nr:hypothetical protein [Halorussus amylolyticus]
MANSPSTADEQCRQSRRLPRRTVLTGLAAVGTAGTAGCVDLIDEVADRALEDVNLFNESSESLEGTIDITGPDGSSVLSERFELHAQTEDEPNEDATGVYADVWQATGTYETSVELDDGFEVSGDSRAERSVSIENPDEQMLAVVFGAEDEEDGILLAVGESLSEFR